MLRIAGVLTLLISLYVTLRLADENALGSRNLIDVANRQGFYGVLTLGVAFYATDWRLRYGHFVWHLFVAAGTVCHFIAVLNYAVRPLR